MFVVAWYVKLFVVVLLFVVCVSRCCALVRVRCCLGSLLFVVCCLFFCVMM